MLACSLVDSTDAMKPRHGEHDEGTRSRLDAVSDFEIRLFRRMAAPFLIDDEFPAPIRVPFFVKIAHHRDPAKRGTLPLHGITLVCVVVGQQTISGGI